MSSPCSHEQLIAPGYGNRSMVFRDPAVYVQYVQHLGLQFRPLGKACTAFSSGLAAMYECIYSILLWSLAACTWLQPMP